MTDVLLAIAAAPVGWTELHLDLLGRLLLAAVLGGAIGLERELSHKPAGLRTNLLICVGAALLTELSINVAAMANAGADGAFRADPARIAAQIVSGIGFLGAGTILQSRGSVTGLTTAATIWVVAAIGMAVGTRAYVEAVGTAVLVVVSLVSLGWAERLVERIRVERRYVLQIDPDPRILEAVKDAILSAGMRSEVLSVEKAAGRYEVALSVVGPSRAHGEALNALLARPEIHALTAH